MNLFVNIKKRIPTKRQDAIFVHQGFLPVPARPFQNGNQRFFRQFPDSKNNNFDLVFIGVRFRLYFRVVAVYQQNRERRKKGVF